MLSYVVKDLLRNPRRTFASVAGVALAVGLFSGIAFFVDSSSAQMTARAVAPVTVDMQAAVTHPLASPLSVSEAFNPSAPLAAGAPLTISIAVANRGADPLSGVVVKESVPTQLVYQPGSLTIDGRPVPDPAGGSGAAPRSPLAAGVRIATLVPGASAVVAYRATAATAIGASSVIASNVAVHSAAYPAPTSPGDAPLVDMASLVRQIRALPGVVAAQPVAILDLPVGSVASVGAAPGPAAPAGQPFKLVALDPAYLRDFPIVHASGGLSSGTAIISQQAADLLATAATKHINLKLPGGATVDLTVSGIGDFSAPSAAPLFASRNPDNQGEVAAAPFVVAIDFATFQQRVLPALRADAAAATPVITAPPVVEIHVAASHAMLSSDPATAAIRTQGLRRTIERLAPGDVKVIDNLSDTLISSQKDATLAKVLFLFLGLPGVLLAAYLSRYAGSLLAEAQRRERALLRARGIQPVHLLRAVAYNTIAVAILGGVLGLGLGIGALVVLFGGLATLGGSPQGIAVSIGASLLAAAVTTTLALYLPSRRALLREVADERREVPAALPPAWMRARLDVVLLAAAALIGAVTYLTGGYQPTPAEGQSVSLSFYILLAPLCFWVGATLLLVRLLLLVARRPVRTGGDASFRRGVVTRALWLGVRRRPYPVASGVIALSLAIAFGVSLAIFLSTYQAEKLADARFVVGGDVRVTPAALVPGQPPNAAAVSRLLQVPGVQASTAVAAASVQVGTDKRSLAAIDPRTFAAVADPSPSLFNGQAPADLLGALAREPGAALMSTELARTFNIAVGDPIKVQLTDRVTGKSVARTLRAAGLFTSLPGFPQGVDLVVGLDFYQSAVHASAPDFYLLRTDGSDAATAAVAQAIGAAAPPSQPVTVETSAKAFNADQSSLSALNVNGLGRLEGLYTILLSALGIAIFVFGMLLQRAKEHVTLRALGIRLRQLQGLVLGEAALVAVLSLVIGLLVGSAIAVMLVEILRPLFVIPPAGIAVPFGELAVLSGLVLGVTVLSSAVAGRSLRRAHLVEILRDE